MLPLNDKPKILSFCTFDPLLKRQTERSTAKHELFPEREVTTWVFLLVSGRKKKDDMMQSSYFLLSTKFQSAGTLEELCKLVLFQFFWGAGFTI